MTKQFWSGIMVVGCLVLGATVAGAVDPPEPTKSYITRNTGFAKALAPSSGSGPWSVSCEGKWAMDRTYTPKDVIISIRVKMGDEYTIIYPDVVLSAATKNQSQPYMRWWLGTYAGSVDVALDATYMQQQRYEYKIWLRADGNPDPQRVTTSPEGGTTWTVLTP